jgi:hypothetical protein
VAGGNFGGGLFNHFGTATLTRCTLSDDVAFQIFGGGIYSSTGLATLTNCTLSNDADAGTGAFSGGGGLDIFSGTATLLNCTLSNNSAATRGGGILNDTANNTNTLNLTNTIVAGNSATGGGPDIFGAVATADHDLVGDAPGSSGITNGVNGDLVGGNGKPVLDPRLGPLQGNGGPTQTLALLPGSPARGHGDNALAPHTEQRGHKRLDTLGEISDIGAFEA